MEATEIEETWARILKTAPHLYRRTRIAFIKFLVLNSGRNCRLSLYRSYSIKER